MIGWSRSSDMQCKMTWVGSRAEKFKGAWTGLYCSKTQMNSRVKGQSSEGLFLDSFWWVTSSGFWGRDDKDFRGETPVQTLNYFSLRSWFCWQTCSGNESNNGEDGESEEDSRRVHDDEKENEKREREDPLLLLLPKMNESLRAEKRARGLRGGGTWAGSRLRPYFFKGVGNFERSCWLRAN